MIIDKARVLSCNRIATDIFKIRLLTNIPEMFKAGQFINIYINDGTALLPRPISVSISELNIVGLHLSNIITIIVQNVGKGTDYISKLQKGNFLSISGPLGNGFRIPNEDKKIVVVGGGMGIAPLLSLSKNLQDRATFLLGFKEEPFLVEKFIRYSGNNNVYVSTDVGIKDTVRGTVIYLLNGLEFTPDVILACGPKPMLKALCKWADIKGVDIQISLEETMACGIGVCLSCVCKIKDDEGNVTNRRLCKDGPVFNGKEVIWNDSN